MRVKSALRHELKYVITREQYESLLGTITRRMTPDGHGDGQGAYAVSSLYFDTPDYKAYWDKLEGHKIRRKVRVRAYGEQRVEMETPVFLEIKQRNNQLMAKRRARLTYGQAVNFGNFEERLHGIQEDEWALLREVFYLYTTLQLQPSCIVRYDRLAFEGGTQFPDLRVTFDTNLRGCVRDLSLAASAGALDRFILSPDLCVLEVKVNRTAPYWLSQLLGDHRCVLQRISKYCTALETNAAINARQRIMMI